MRGRKKERTSLIILKAKGPIAIIVRIRGKTGEAYEVPVPILGVKKLALVRVFIGVSRHFILTSPPLLPFKLLSLFRK